MQAKDAAEVTGTAEAAETVAGGMDVDPLRHAKRATAFLHASRDGGIVTWKFRNHQFFKWSRAAKCYKRMDEEAAADHILQWLTRNSISSDPRFARDVLSCVRSEIRVSEEQTLPYWVGQGRRRLIAFRNGRLDLDAYIAKGRAVVEPHSPHWFSEVCLPYKWDAGAKCPKFTAWLSEAVEGDREREAAIRQWFGYLLSGEVKRQTALFLVGPGGTGKSTLAEVMRLVVGESNCSEESLDRLGSNDFAMASTEGKLLNVADETRSDRLTEKMVAVIKRFIGASPVPIERKGIDSYPARPTARLVVCLNKWPRIADDTNAFYRRLLVAPFRRLVPRERMDPRLTDKFVPELPGIAAWAMRGLATLERDGWTRPRAGEDEIADVRGLNQAMTVWMEQRLVADPEGAAIATDLLDDLKLFCETNGWPFNASVQKLRHAIREKYGTAVNLNARPRVGTQRLRAIAGVRLR